MVVEFVNLYCKDGKLLMVPYSALTGNPKCLLEKKGVLRHFSMTIKNKAIMKLVIPHCKSKNVSSLQDVNNIMGVEFQTRSTTNGDKLFKRHYFDIKEGNTTSIKKIVGGNISLAVIEKRGHIDE